jgi:hypothetical protein
MEALLRPLRNVELVEQERALGLLASAVCTVTSGFRKPHSLPPS